MIWGAAVVLAMAVCGIQPGPTAALGNKIEVSGRITKVGLAFGQGMPSLEVKTGAGKVWKVWLGSMRYLVEQNFNPKAGQEVQVYGFKPGAGAGMCCGTAAAGAGDVIAFSVTLVATKQTIRLRDDSGMPLWRGRFRRGRP